MVFRALSCAPKKSPALRSNEGEAAPLPKQ
jgi:hypothetical protein